MNLPAKPRSNKDEEANKAMRFLALKAAIFILVPALAAIIAVMVMLK